MKTYDEMEFHPDSEKLVKILCDKTENTNPLFFRVMVAYYFTQVASMMRTKIDSPERGIIPVNMYAINLMTSGAGKGHSTNIIEDSILNQFIHNFRERTFPALADANLPVLANQRAIRSQTDPDDELTAIMKEFKALGPLAMSFDSGTAPAVKQARQKLLMANAGSLNLQMDEIGSNLVGNMEVLNAFLELFDMGKIGQKLIKNTSDNTRFEEIKGATPTNMMLFGTPYNLLDGGKTEEEFTKMLLIGYARRSFFGYSRTHDKAEGLTPDEILDRALNPVVDQFMRTISDRLGKLSDMVHVGKKLAMTRDVSLLFIEYRLACQALTAKMGEHEEVRKAELDHRYFKSMKVAGAYAFIDGSPEITLDHAYNAIKLAEQSGKAFEQILTRDRSYVKLAKYIADIHRPVTQADLVEDLPFYKGSVPQKNEIMQLAIAYGYQNNILIKKEFTDGVEFIRGETLMRTDVNKMIVSYSTDLAIGYQPDTATFDQLHKLTQSKGMHWCNHCFIGDHRVEDKAIPGFNLIVLDVDHGISVRTAQALLKDYKSLFYTTKRHTDADHRFRILLPTNYVLKLDTKDYKEFMQNVFHWLPFEVDSATGQRNRKWLSHPGLYKYQDGELLDVLPFIPKTSKNEDFKTTVIDQQGMDNLERWVINNTGDGNRNNMLLRFAMILVDAGFDFEGVRQRVTILNDKLPDKLGEAEIMGTVMVTVGKTLATK